jgi:2-polyprenyl-3-methyl-5-hydroxy-6-metoxy-1,4-benzoquinol methylase
VHATTSIFDGMAEAYDGQFTRTMIGSMMRRAVWSRCAARFLPGSRILEMNCGTGEDALWLAQRGIEVVATDVSSAMLRIAKNKLTASPGKASVRFHKLAWEDLAGLDDGPFDGVLSNFGGLNCVEDMRATAPSLAAKLRPGAVAILCIMGPTVPWEWAWFLSQGKPAAAFRRMRRRGTQWAGATIQYPSIAKTRMAFTPEFRLLRVSAIGALLPPPYTEKKLSRYPRLIAALEHVERRFDTRWPLAMLADHYLLELERV